MKSAIPVLTTCRAAGGVSAAPPTHPSILKFAQAPHPGLVGIELAPDLIEPGRPFPSVGVWETKSMSDCECPWWLKLKMENARAVGSVLPSGQV